MITVEKLEKGTYFDDAFKISFRYDPTTVAKVKELAERRYLPEDRAWEIPAHELPALIEKVGLSNIKSEEAVVQALNTKEIEDKREATQERLKGIKPVRDFDFKTAPLPHQIEAFNYGMEKNSLLIGDEQGLGKTKESIDICVARKKELIKTLIVCGVNSVKYNWEKEIQIHSNEGCVMVDGKTTTVEKFASTLRDNAGEDPVVALAIVDQSIDKGWKDLYPLKNYGRQGKPTAVSKKFSGNTLKDAEGKDIVFK